MKPSRSLQLLFAAALATACSSGSGTSQSSPESTDGGGDATASDASSSGGGDGSSGKDASGGADAGGDAQGPITTHPTNLLNNGGFESGTMCYGQYEWGANPSNVGTGYQFSLSTSDVHGGKYAAQIACVNASDCGYPAKAALQASPTFHTPHNQAYKVTAWTKCPAGDLAFFYTPNAATGTSIPNFTCNGAWAQNAFTFTSTPTDDYVYYALYYAGKGTFLVDDVVITYGDGSVPAQTIKHPGARAAGVTNGVYTVDGKPFLPLGFYDVPAEQLAMAKQLGVNAVAWGDPGCFNTDAPQYADVAYEAGIGLIPESSTTSRMGAPAVFPGVMQQFGRHLDDIAWYLDDEPDITNIVYQPITPMTLGAEYQAVHGASQLPVGVMLQHAHYDPPSVDQPYAPAMDVYLSEPYGPTFDGITHSMTVFATMTKRPVWFAMDDGPDASAIVPKAYFGFTSGGSGLLYFTWGQFQTDAKLTAAGQAITELGSLADAITGTDVTSQISAPSAISFIGRQAGGKTYILAVNPAATNVTATFAYAPLTSGQSVAVQFENRTVTAAAGSFGDTFTGISRHVYVIP
ncbi:MAG TPA: hypothetical protein VF765_10745 [Polyangiaceae bacterium]